ncbi:MAG: M16 family metallopeptidase [Pseudomonadota bacterium]
MIKNSKNFSAWMVALAFTLLPAAHVSAAPKIQQWQTANGARVYFVPAPELPMVDVQVIFDAGSTRDAGKNGLAKLTASLLNEGAGALNADQIAERFDDLGAQFSAGAQLEMATASLRSLNKPEVLQPALETMALILRQPTFPQDGLERERKRMLIGLKGELESPAAIGDKAFEKALYGGHPYGQPPNGTEESVKALSRDDVVNHHKQYYVARNAVVAIVGALDRGQAEALAGTLIGKLPEGEAAAALPKVADLAAAQTITIDHPSSQSHIFSGQPGMARNDPDYFPLYVGNHTLGGSGLVSRLSEEIREKRGLSYSVYSYFVPLRDRGPYIMGLQTRNEQAQQALRVMNDTLRKFVTEGPTAKELTASKQNITGGFPLRIDTNKKILDHIGMIGFYNLPPDFLDTYIARIDAVTLPQIRDAFQRRIHPDRMATVIVGRTAANGAVK